MRCTQVRRHLSAYQDGALDEAQRDAVGEHLAQCPECATRLAELQRAWQALEVCEPAETAPGFTAAVMRRLGEKLPRPAWQAPRWAVAAALILCLVCGGLVGHYQPAASPVPAGTQIALAVDASQQLGIEAFAPSPADTVAGAYVQFTGTEGGR